MTESGGRTPLPTPPGCVCEYGLSCGPCQKQARDEDIRRQPYAGRRYRNTEGLRGHANARKRADS